MAATPVALLITLSMETYYRARWTYALEMIFTFMGHSYFAILFMPSRSNSMFPFAFKTAAMEAQEAANLAGSSHTVVTKAEAAALGPVAAGKSKGAASSASSPAKASPSPKKEEKQEEDEKDGKKKTSISTNAALIGHKVCARIHHMRFSQNLTLELVSRELLSNGVAKKMDKEKKVKTKDGVVILPTTRGRVTKVVNVAEYVYTDGVFAETSYLNMVEQLVAEYEQSLEKKDK